MTKVSGTGVALVDGAHLRAQDRAGTLRAVVVACSLAMVAATAVAQGQEPKPEPPAQPESPATPASAPTPAPGASEPAQVAPAPAAAASEPPAPVPAAEPAASAVAPAAAVVPAPAPSAAGSSSKLERVEITGSNIKRIDAETSSPVQVLTRQDIRRTGAGSVRELIDSLSSSNPTSLSDISGSNSFASGASSASLRNLGKQSTLVLLNFRRVSPYALADFNEIFTNLDALPLDAVERVEILRSGASAIYGSDAVAGVINIITRRDYRGFQVQASTEQSLRSHTFNQHTVSATGGFGDFNADRFNLLANVELFKRDSVIWRDVLDDMNPVTFARLPQTRQTQFSAFSYPGNVDLAPVAGCPAELVIGGLCRFDRFSRFEAMPAAERVNLLVSGRLNISSELEGFSEVLFSRTKTTYISPFQPYGNALGSTTWGDPLGGPPHTFTHRGLPAGHPLNATADEADFRYRFIDAPAEGTPTSDNYRVLLGLRGTLAGYDWESAVGFLGAKTTDLQRGQFSDSGFRAVIGDYTAATLDPSFFNQPGGYRIGQANSAAVVDTLFPSFGNHAKTSQTVLDGKISGEIFQLPAGPVGLAAGFDVRREKLSIIPTDNLAAGDIVGFGLSTTDAERTFGAVFGELNVPITKKVESQLAARVDRFPGFGAQVSPKIGVKYVPTRELLLRGTVETGFRAPNLTENAQSTKFSFSNGVTDPQRCDQALAYASDLRAQAAPLPNTDPQKTQLTVQADIVEQNECSAGVSIKSSSNPALKPEVSKSITLGAVLEPTPGLTFSLDFWHIYRKDEIGIKDTQELLEAEGNLPAGASITRAALNAGDQSFDTAAQNTYGVTTGAITSLTNIFENVSKTKTSGFDIGVNATTALAIGRLDIGFQATYLKDYKSWSTVADSYGDNLAGRHNFPRLTATLLATLASGPYTNGLKFRHTSSTALQSDYFDNDWTIQGCADKSISENECRVATAAFVDYFFTYTGVKNLTFTTYIKNLWGTLPPADLRNLFEGGGNTIPQEPGDAQRRTLKLIAEYKFY